MRSPRSRQARSRPPSCCRWPRPNRARRADAGRRQHARGIARGSARRDPELLLDVRGADAGPSISCKRESRAPSQRDANVARSLRSGDRPVEQVKLTDKVAWANVEGDRGVTFADNRQRVPRSSRGHGGRAIVRAAAVVDGEGGGGRPRPPSWRHGRRQRAWSRVRRKSANLRKVNWKSFAINFVLVYSPNAVRALHRTGFSGAAVGGAGGRLKLMRAVAQDFPPMSRASGCGEAMENVETLVAKLALAIRAGRDRGGAHDLGPGARRRARRRRRLALRTRLFVKILGATHRAGSR